MVSCVCIAQPCPRSAEERNDPKQLCSALQVGDSFTASLTVEKSSGSRVSFGTVCRHDSTGTVVVEGTALALIQQRYSGGSASGQD